MFLEVSYNDVPVDILSDVSQIFVQKLTLRVVLDFLEQRTGTAVSDNFGLIVQETQSPVGNIVTSVSSSTIFSTASLSLSLYTYIYTTCTYIYTCLLKLCFLGGSVALLLFWKFHPIVYHFFICWRSVLSSFCISHSS